MFISGADIIVKTLIEHGCDTVFGYPGGQILNVYDSLYTHQNEINHKMCIRDRATGYGLVYIVDEMLKAAGKTLKDQRVAISGAGNVAIYAAEKATQLGAKVVTLSDSNGWIYDEEGVDLAAVKEIKEVKRGRIKEYLEYRPNAEYHEGKGVWSVKCDIALPCATQNELLEEDAKTLVANGCYAVGEGANMPSSLEAIDVLIENGILFAPAKAANAGGVACLLYTSRCV